MAEVAHVTRDLDTVHFQGQKVKGQGHQAAFVGCSIHHITYFDASSLYATAQSHHLHGGHIVADSRTACLYNTIYNTHWQQMTQAGQQGHKVTLI